MTEKYNPLRVPIALLHARAYTTSRRLGKWKPLVAAELIKKPTFGSVWLNGERQPYPFARTYTLLNNIFDVFPYDRKAWILVDGISTASCRSCNLITKDDQTRNAHFSCCREINIVLRELISDEICIICEEPLDRQKAVIEFQGCPVCSDECRDIWDVMNPEGFDLYLAKLKKDGKLK